ncbi:hypothetical protein M0R45_030345 [Rubus argutus]|uniref:Uncharacterized protein n=1 Tax=Rubus argutus TaxID=59490 RepID=A0AAW1WAQ4_RUBAR
MEDMSEHQRAIAWLWVVEGLATMKQVDVSLLTDLLGEIGSSLPDHMAKNAKERVALRCLEEIFNGVPCTQNSKVGIDLSQSCESVLKRITDETPESDLRNAGPGLLKWDIHPFILHKKAAMPKCALKQLKESILDGTHPHADLLREKSGLTFRSDGDRVSANESNQGLNKSCSSAQNMGVEGNSDSLILENVSRLLEEDKNLPKRDRICSGYVNDSDDRHIKAKKLKLDASYVSQSKEQNQISLHGREHLQDTSERDVPVSVSDRCDLVENQMIMEQNWVLEDGHNDYAASKRYRQNSDDAIHKNQTENHSNATSMRQDTCQDETHQYSCVGEANNDGRLHRELRISNADPLDETKHKVSAKEFNCNSEQDAHCKVPRLSSTDETRQMNNADEGNGPDPENLTDKKRKSVDDSDDCHVRAKNMKWDASYVLQSIEQNQLPLYSEDSSERDVPVSERVRCDLAENQMEMMEEDRGLEDGHDDYTESKRNGQSTYDAIHESQQENCCNATSMPRDIIQDESCQYTCVDETKYDGGLQLELRASGVTAADESRHKVSPKVFNNNTDIDFHIKVPHPATTDGPQRKSLADEGKDDCDHCSKPRTSGVASLDEIQQKNSSQQSDCVSEHDSHIKVAYPASVFIDESIADKSKGLMDFRFESVTSNDNDGFHDEKIDAAMKKHAFLRFQCTSTHDSSVTTVTEKSHSMDCNEGGQLLTCKTSNCPVVVDEKWLFSSAIFYEKGNFYCPFCSYSLALTDYLESKKETSQLERVLNAFVQRELNTNLENQPKEPVGRLHGKANNFSMHFEESHYRHLEEGEENQGNQCEEHVTEVDDVQLHNFIYNKQQEAPSSSCLEVKSIHGKVHVPAGEKKGEEKLVHECISVAGLDGFQNQVPEEGERFSSKAIESLLVDQGQPGAVTEQEVRQQPDDSEEPVHELKVDSAQIPDYDVEKSDTLKNSVSQRSKSPW